MNLFRKIAPTIWSFFNWKKRGFNGHAPQYVKKEIFKKYGIPNAVWIETGTFLGDTTAFLTKISKKVYSIEPSAELFEKAQRRLKNTNAEIINDISENVFPLLLPKIQFKQVNFWLDGHYSAGATFQGPKNCPVVEELASIQENLNSFDELVILIDDVRCFDEKNFDYPDYPSLDYLVDFCRKNNFYWMIEQDIFIMTKK